MSCSANLLGLPISCDHSMGGISRVWIAPYAVNAATSAKTEISEGVSGETITALTTTDFKYYYFKKDTASMTSTLNVDAANGVNYVSTELAMVFNKMETAKRIEIASLSVYDTMVVVKDANGSYWFLGFDNPVTATAGEGHTGTAKTDGNAYQITLTDESNTYPLEITSEEVIAALEAMAK